MTDLLQTYQLFIHAPPAAVFSAVVDGQKTAQYFFGTAFSGELEKGAKYRYAFPDGTVAVDGEVLAVEPDALLECTWAVHYDPSCAGEKSHVSWKLEARGELTRVTLVHDCREAPNTARNVGNDGWSLVLSGLKTLVETGRAMPPPPMG